MTVPAVPYGWVPQYFWHPEHGWTPQYVWDAQRGWVPSYIWAPLPPGWAPPMPAVRYAERPHSEPTPYLRLLHTRSYGWWKSLLGLLLAMTVWFGAAVLLAVALGVFLIVGGAESVLTDLQTDPLSTPVTLLVTNISLALLIPAVWVAVLVVHQERLGWVSSVARRLRWRLLLGFGALAGVLLVLGLLLGAAFSSAAPAGGGQPRSTSFVLGMIAVVVLTTPLQAAGEEYFFRGYLSQVIAGWVPGRVAGAVLAGLVSGILFALAHGSQSGPAFADRLAFGLAASLLVWLTGGLEASIAYHTMNNALLFLLTLLVGPDVQVQASGALVLGVDLCVLVAFVAVVWWWSRRSGVQRLSRCREY